MRALTKILNEIRIKKASIHDYATCLIQSKFPDERMFCAEMISKLYGEISIAESLIGEVN